MVIDAGEEFRAGSVTQQKRKEFKGGSRKWPSKGIEGATGSESKVLSSLKLLSESFPPPNQTLPALSSQN
ncbi:hypothetical protein Ancab_038810 [Ancistrocladus abbreviatus]